MLFRANRWLIALLLLTGSNVLFAAKSVQPSINTSNLPPRPNKAAVFFYRTSEWIDQFVMKNIDTAYIGLPEHSWRLAFTTGMVGVNSRFTAEDAFWEEIPLGNVSLLQRTTPSFNLGLYAGFRGFGFGYSWDALHAYSQNMVFSLGGKWIGLEFMRQTSSNIRQFLEIDKEKIPVPEDLQLHNTITNTTFSVWYALNSKHYSHNAAIKQAYIQKKTAGSLLLQVAYMSTDVKLDSLFSFIGDISEIETHQIGVGLGYGINYTPNKGKVLLHLAAMAQLICFSHNLVAELPLDSNYKYMPTRLYRVQSRYPVHVTGTVRAAVSWEINKWVHLNAWAQGKNIRFMAKADKAGIKLSNWDWTVNLAVGVRLGAGYDRRQKVLDDEEEYVIAEENEILREAARLRIQANKNDSLLLAQAATIEEWNAIADSISAERMQEAKEQAEQLKTQSSKTKRKHHRSPLPKWITDFFYSPMQ